MRAIRNAWIRGGRRLRARIIRRAVVWPPRLHLVDVLHDGREAAGVGGGVRVVHTLPPALLDLADEELPELAVGAFGNDALDGGDLILVTIPAPANTYCFYRTSLYYCSPVTNKSRVIPSGTTNHARKV